MSFNAFVDVVCFIPDATADNHFRSQLYQLSGSTGTLMVDYIGKLETLSASLQEITQQSGMLFEQIPHLHKKSTKPYWEFYDDQLTEKVRLRYRGDAEFFEYEFKPVTKTRPLGSLDKTQINNFAQSEIMQAILKEKKAQHNNRKRKTNLKKSMSVSFSNMMSLLKRK